MSAHAGTRSISLPRDPRQRIYFDFWPCGRGAAKGIWGSFPKGFYARMKAVMGEGSYLFVCSGSISEGVTVDINPERKPTVVADAQCLPFADNVFDVVIVDPPYSAKDAEIYGTKHFPAHRALWEAARVARPGGRVGFLHYMVPKTPPGTKRVGMVAVTCGPCLKIRAFSIFEKLPVQMRLEIPGAPSHATN